ncbi:alpha/beta fold hydrolase [Undibacterium umbellatum]|uniref:Alpha/beta hydrolase n=1 Tax=Undibacterium umbellatum TaxID=2762300 RepID=A0ABR6ZEN8_9BURK|nr:alpha/beta hydrolase [Undibacterium umbellatum]MBC3909677.1 alpha/beta hydrolase [Undibacterium umbellatum]
MPLRRHLLKTILALACAALSPVAAWAAAFSSDRISIKTEGEGRDVILVPGLSSSPRVWAEVVKAVPGYRYHLVQVSGFAGQAVGGNTEGAVAAPVAEEIARYIASIVQPGVQKPLLIGHSMGGSIGMMLAARHPQAVSKLMVVDMLPFLGAMFGPPGTTAQSIKPVADDMLAKMRAATPEARAQRTEAAIKSMINTAAMRAPAVEDGLRSDPDVSARAYHELVTTDLTAELKNIVVPTSVVYVVPNGVPLSSEQMDGFYKMAYANVKEIRLKHIPASAHFIMWDQPDQFQAEVRSFLK